MEWHVNDCSLAGQFGDGNSAKIVFERLLALRARRADLRGRLYCSRHLGQRNVLNGVNLQAFTFALADRNLKSGILRWIGNQGPFWTDARMDVEGENDLFYFRQADVTDTGLGEVARRSLVGIAASSFSFDDCQLEYRGGTLALTHGLLDEPIDTLEIENCYGLDALEASETIEVDSWQTMLAAAAHKKWLLFSPGIADVIRAWPFNSALAQRLLQLLQVLSDIADHSDQNGQLSARGLELRELYFVGKNAWFSDEDYSEEFFFADPTAEEQMYCSWHAKTKQGGQFRIHFQWPRPAGQREIKIGYIGMKLTKW